MEEAEKQTALYTLYEMECCNVEDAMTVAAIVYVRKEIEAGTSLDAIDVPAMPGLDWVLTTLRAKMEGTEAQ